MGEVQSVKYSFQASRLLLTLPSLTASKCHPAPAMSPNRTTARSVCPGPSLRCSLVVSLRLRVRRFHAFPDLGLRQVFLVRRDRPAVAVRIFDRAVAIAPELVRQRHLL